MNNLPTLPDKRTWAAFKAERNGFTPGTCEHCGQPADKLRWHTASKRFVHHTCWDWLEAERGDVRAAARGER